jgi:predicted O-methyltransferase YrrM
MILQESSKKTSLFSILHSALIIPFYLVRFLYFSLKERSLWFYRYYPGHYGSTIPSATAIQKNRDVLFGNAFPSEDGIDLNATNQEKLLEKISILFADFSPPKSAVSSKRYYYDNPKFGFNDACILYSFMRMFKPSRIIEIGSGYSSALMIDTAEEFLPDSHLTFIDPYSTTVGPLLEGASFKNHEIVRKDVREVGLNIFRELKSNDILFIDSSHVLKIGSDLSSLFFSIVPSLQPGVIIHIHDIWYPFEYPEHMIKEGRIWNEIYFVRAFLQYNQSFEILFFSSFMEQHKKDYMSQHMPGYLPGAGASLWLRKIG